MHERTVTVTVTRTIYVATCEKCGDRTEVADNPPRERYCNKCGIWVKFEPVSFTGPELTKNGK